MSLGLPGQILEINERVAVVDFWGVRRVVRLDILTETVVAGDYIIDHDGYAIRRIPVEEVADTVAMYEIVAAEA